MLSPKLLGLLVAGVAFTLAAPAELNKAQAELAVSTKPSNEEVATEPNELRRYRDGDGGDGGYDGDGGGYDGDRRQLRGYRGDGDSDGGYSDGGYDGMTCSAALSARYLLISHHSSAPLPM